MKLVSAFVFSALLAAASVCSAHTDLAHSVPGNDAVVNVAPQKMELHFTGKVRLLKFSIVDKSGTEVPTEFKPSADALDHFEVSLPAMLEDSYTVKWSAMGDDQHLVEKSFGFTVDADAKASDEAAAPAASHSH